jgi:hypothetical protein
MVDDEDRAAGAHTVPLPARRHIMRSKGLQNQAFALGLWMQAITAFTCRICA